MARSLLVFALLFLTQYNYAQRRISIIEMKNFIGTGSSRIEAELKAAGYRVDDEETDGTIGDWGIIKHYIDETDTRLSLTINKKLSVVKAARVYSTDKLQYQRMLQYLDLYDFKKIAEKKKNSTVFNDRYADLWKESKTGFKVIVKYKDLEEQEPYEVEISKDINYTNIEK